MTEKREMKTDKVMMWATIAIAISAIVSLWFSYLMLKSNILQSEINKQLQRPYVGIAGPVEVQVKEYGYKFPFAFTNFGNGPALNVSARYRVFYDGKEATTNLHSYKKTAAIFPNIPHFFELVEGIDLIDKVKSGDVECKIEFIFEYESIFDDNHITIQKYKMMPNLRLFPDGSEVH